MHVKSPSNLVSYLDRFCCRFLKGQLNKIRKYFVRFRSFNFIIIIFLGPFKLEVLGNGLGHLGPRPAPVATITIDQNKGGSGGGKVMAVMDDDGDDFHCH